MRLSSRASAKSALRVAARRQRRARHQRVRFGPLDAADELVDQPRAVAVVHLLAQDLAASSTASSAASRRSDSWARAQLALGHRARATGGCDRRTRARRPGCARPRPRRARAWPRGSPRASRSRPAALRFHSARRRSASASSCAELSRFFAMVSRRPARYADHGLAREVDQHDEQQQQVRDLPEHAAAVRALGLRERGARSGEQQREREERPHESVRPSTRAAASRASASLWPRSAPRAPSSAPATPVRAALDLALGGAARLRRIRDLVAARALERASAQLVGLLARLLDRGAVAREHGLGLRARSRPRACARLRCARRARRARRAAA